MGLGCKTKIGIILTKKNSVLCPGSKHSIRFINSLCDQVVNQYSDICFISTKNERLFTKGLQGSINSSNNSLAGSLFITRCAIDLTG